MQEILDHETDPLQFRVRWKGYGADSDTWKGYSNVKDSESFKTYVLVHEENRALQRELRTAKKTASVARTLSSPRGARSGGDINSTLHCVLAGVRAKCVSVLSKALVALPAEKRSAESLEQVHKDPCCGFRKQSRPGCSFP